MTDDDAQARYPGCTRVVGSPEVRHVEPFAGHSMGAALVRRDDGAITQPEPPIGADPQARGSAVR